MSEYVAFSPVDWPLFERVGLHAAASPDPAALGRLLASETYWSSAADRSYLAAIPSAGAIAASALPTLVATRVDPHANAERAAPLLLDENAKARDRCRAELARSGADYPLLYDVDLLFACHSPAYANYLLGEGGLVDGRVPYDGPGWFAAALGGPQDPQALRSALLPPAEVANLARHLEAHDPGTVLAALDPELRDFHHDNFGDENSLETFVEEAVELLQIFYDDAASRGCGFLIRGQ